MSCENCEESAYVIDKLAKLLAEIAVIVNGPEPPLTSWSYHDLPEKVRALKQSPPATVPAGYALVPVELADDAIGVVWGDTAMTDKQPDALALADHLEQFRSFPDDLAAAAELRRLHAELVELRRLHAELVESDALRSENV